MDLRTSLIASGAIRPTADEELRRIELPPGTPVLLLDEAGRAAAERRLTQARQGVWDTLLYDQIREGDPR
jgi:hypothetical protein